VSVVLFLLIVSPLATHALRAWIIRNGWLEMTAVRLLPRTAAAVLVIAGSLGLMTAIVNVVVLRNGLWRTWFPQAVFGVTSGWAMGLSTWLWLYFTVHDRRRRRELEVHALRLEVVAREARLRTLESQLNPHFLFNSLNSVRALVVEDPQRAQTMITRLSELLRYTLESKGHDEVSLGDEMRAVEDYLAIERVRFEERLTADVDAEPAARVERVPQMLILTLVENAVKHGISRLTLGGSVTVRAAVDGDRLLVRVVNTGSLGARPRGGGVGLSNARERLQLIYGDAASLTLEPDGHSVVARVSVPLRTAGAQPLQATA
jgi:Histidine kinase